MNRIIVGIAVVVVGMVACKSGGRKDMVIGEWHAVKLENPEMDSFFAKSQAYIDTIGNGHDEAANIALYGTANMDSLKKILQGQFDTAKSLQAKAVLNTMFNFRKDGKAVLSFNGNTDSSAWFLSKEDTLVLDELDKNGQGEKIKMEIISLTDGTMKLRFVENNTASTVTFNKEGK